MTYETFKSRTVNGQPYLIPVDELLRILLSGYLPDETAFDGVKIQGAITATVESVSLTGDLPDTAAGDLAAIKTAVEGTLAVDATGQGDVPVTLDGESVAQTPRAASSGNMNAPAANTAAVVTKSAGGAGVRNVIGGIYWSYVGDTPSGGSLSVTDDGINVFSEGISAEGPGFFNFIPPMQFGDNTDVVVTLAAGGASVVGRLNLHAWTE